MSPNIAGVRSRTLIHGRGARAGGWRLRVAVTLVLVPLAFAVHAAAAAARTQIQASSPEQRAFLQAWVDESLTLTPDARVSVTPSICPGGEFMSCATYSSAGPTIAFPDVRYLFAGPYAADTLDQTRSRLEFLHELGHVFDWTYSHGHGAARALRSRFLRIMDISGSGTSERLWRSGQIGRQTVSPHELFAMGYSYCAAYPTLPVAVMQSVFWGYNYAPTASQYAQVCALIGHPLGDMVGAVAASARGRRSVAGSG